MIQYLLFSIKITKINDIYNDFGDFVRLFLCISPHLFPLAVVIRNEYLTTTSSYPKGMWYFDAVALIEYAQFGTILFL